MKFRKLPALLLAVLLTLLSTGIAGAQTAYQTSFTTSITYANVGAGSASITITYYSENNGTGIPVTMAALPAGASSSVFVGNVSSIGASFKGAAVLSSDQPVVATLVQSPPSASPTVKNRPLSNGFLAGSSRVLLASVLKGAFGFNTVFSVQNAGSAAANFNVTLNPTTGAAIVIPVTGLPVGAAKYFDMGTLAQVPAGFNGSAVIEGTGVSLVATAMEMQTTGPGVSAFEGVSGGANKVFMPSALCSFNVSGQPTNTSYAIQNVGTTTTSAVVTFSSGKTVNTGNILAGKKFSVQGCNGGNAAGFTGSATIQAATGGQIVVLGKVSGAGISSAFLGEAAGAPKLVLPYVRYTTTGFNATVNRQRTFIAIQNVGGNLAANTVNVRFYNAVGTLVGTYTIPTAIATGAKVSVNPTMIGAAGAEFGYAGGVFGGGVQIQGPAGSQLVAVARVVSFLNATTQPGEDYNAVAIQ